MITFNKESWHYYVATKFGNIHHWDTETDICTYTRSVIQGVILLLFITFIVAFLACLFLTPYVWMGYMVFKGFVPANDWITTCSILDIILWGIITLQILTEKFLNWLNTRQRKVKHDNFIKASYKAFKGKYCAKVTFK